jgi:hypothetical protein
MIMSYKNEKNVIEDCYVGGGATSQKHFASHPHKIPKDLTITFGCRGTFEVIIQNNKYIINKVE